MITQPAWQFRQPRAAERRQALLPISDQHVADGEPAIELPAPTPSTLAFTSTQRSRSISGRTPNNGMLTAAMPLAFSALTMVYSVSALGVGAAAAHAATSPEPGLADAFALSLAYGDSIVTRGLRLCAVLDFYQSGVRKFEQGAALSIGRYAPTVQR